jgi:glutamate-5-semialdehyde dehydrogenase
MSAAETIAEQSSVDVEELCREMAASAKAASQALPLVSTQTKNDYLNRAADEIERHADQIIVANEKDIANAPRYGLSPAAIDRLRLNKDRIKAIADGIRVVASLPDPVGETIDSFRRPNGLAITQVRVPLGVVFFIYESRPNVTADAAAICLKSGNAVILRGGKEALHSSREIVSIMQRTLDEFGLDRGAIQLVPITDRATVGHFLKMSGSIDVAIPRGGKELIQRVADEATMPVIKHFDGICHVYVDPTADFEMALNIIENSKCQRMGVCNAMECLIVHRDIAATFLPQVQQRLASYSITYHADPTAIKFLPGAKPAAESNWSTEYLGPEMSVRVVSDLNEAIAHIGTYGSGHTDSIVSNDYEAIETFLNAVDSSAVVANASTRFNDGGEFGFGAEIGISTDKFHARGPCGLRELTSYKYIVRGNGQVRN